MIDKKCSSESIKHYLQPEVRELIYRFSQAGPYFRQANGDRYGWYHNGKFANPTDAEKYIINPTTKAGYDFIATQRRVMYSTLNFYDEEFFKLNFAELPKPHAKIAREHMRAITAGLDIDTKNTSGMHGENITDSKPMQAVTAMARYVVKHLKQWVPNSVYVLFSGGGIYVLIHHEVFQDFFREHINGKDGGLDYEQWVIVFRDALNSFFGDIVKRFYEEHPEHEPYVKGDLINSSRRVFKAPYSLHRSHDFAVIPMDPDDTEINFNDATIPLKPEILERGRDWYTRYDSDGRLYEYLKAEYFKRAETKQRISKYRIWNSNIDTEISKVPIRDGWPPCINNILNFAQNCEGITRSLFLLAAFLGQVGIEEDEARNIFYGLAERTGAATSNIFESAYRQMHCPSCDKLRDRDNTAFPTGVSIRVTGACKPDIKCNSGSCWSPAFYANDEMRHSKLKTRLTDDG